MSGPDPAGPDLLAGAGALRAADRYALAPAMATAGAQVRAVAEQLAAARFDRPRSLIVLDPAGTGDGPQLAALLPHAAAPVVTAPSLPHWAGPLDLAVVLASAPDDRQAAGAAAEAARRGASLVVRGAMHGPVAAAAGAALLPPRLAIPELAAGAGRLALLLAVAAAAGIAPADDPDLGAVADALDGEALACGPGAEPFVNPALALARRLLDGPAVFLAADPLGMALAERCARSVRLLGGRPAAAQHATGLLPGGQLTAALTRAPDVFADPDLDGPDAGGPVPVLVEPQRRGAETAAVWTAVTRALPRAPLLAPDEAGPAPAAAVLALRVDFAAAYLGIAAGQVAPPDGPDGLGPVGGARDVRPATTVEDVTRDDATDWDDRRWS